MKKSQFEVLERISGFTMEQAKDYLLKNLENELVHEKAVKVMEIEQQTRDEAEKERPGDHCTGHPALRRRPCGGSGDFRGAPAQ